VRVIGMLVVSALLAATSVADLWAATDATDDEPAAGGGASSGTKKKDPKDVLVPIPFWSPDVKDNGCRVRNDPHEIFAGPDVDIQHVPFFDLISHAIGRYSVRAILDHPVKFMASLASLDEETRTLVLLDVLRDGLGRDGLHTFFYLSAGAHAPAVRDALKAARLEREHALFVQAMALFGDSYPIDNAAREKLFGYSSDTQQLNAFDERLMEIGRSFGSREALTNVMVEYVNGRPTLWQRVEALRAKLGTMDRLRSLNQALMRRIDIWDEPDAVIEQRLAVLPTEQRTLFVIDIFNGEFENGGVHQFFYNSSGSVAPEVHGALIELGLDRQAAIFKRGLDMFGSPYPRGMEQRRDAYFSHPGWTDWDKQLQALTDDFYALDGGPTVVRMGGNAAVEGGPGIWSAMGVYARLKNLLPC
jgi:hypothetical protein